METRHYAVLLRALGIVILLTGAASALLGPVELTSFYLFSEGGRFSYEGFGFGSFLFGFIAVQIVGYYVIGLILIPVGYGHLHLRRWARRLSISLLWCWLVLGVPLLIVIAFTVFSFKDLPVAGAIALLIALALTYPLLPLLMISFYRCQGVRRAFQRQDPRENPSWVQRLPMPVLVLAILLAFYAVVLHFPILFNGLFPVFGTWLTGLPGIIALTVAIALTVVLVWGVLKRRRWAWWTSLATTVVMGATVVVTFSVTSYAELLALARFPPRELEFLDGVPLRGYHLAVFFGLPLLGTLGVIIAARRHFREQEAKPGVPLSESSLAGEPLA